jgi:hypothetical protein
MSRKLTAVHGLRFSPRRRKEVSTPKTGTRLPKIADLPAPIFETPSMYRKYPTTVDRMAR